MLSCLALSMKPQVFIIAASAMEEGNPVHSAETIGMAQRGGPVTSHVRIGDSAFSPLIPIGGA
ncbi:MAG: 2-oxoacid:acceptor oxidoreductase family protein, partial [Ruminococcus sp.]|nr:2-oxoacid:acceptor oxidoreductase family protein [Ruminococcus sp.]